MITRIENTGKLKAYFAWIDPDSAQALLDNQYRNRPLNRRTRDKIADDIFGGDFPITGESIIIAENGQLVDGQTRLSACVKAGKRICVLIAEGVSIAAIEKIDTGVCRSIGNRLHIDAGLENANNLGCISLWIYKILMGSQFIYSSSPVAYKELRRIAIEWEKDVTRSLGIVGRGQSRNNLVSRCGLARPIAFHAVVARKYTQEADDFFGGVASGLGLTDFRDPIKLLLDRIGRDGKKSDYASKCALIGVMAEMWNAYMADKKPRGIKFKPGDAIPSIIGVPSLVDVELQDAEL